MTVLDLFSALETKSEIVDLHYTATGICGMVKTLDGVLIEVIMTPKTEVGDGL